jgi:hypothetical protein
MALTNSLDQYLREIHDARFKQFEQDVVHRQALFDRAKKFEQSRDKRRREFLKGVGVNLATFDGEQDKELKIQEQELKSYLDEFVPKVASRPVLQAADSKDAALRAGAFGEAKHTLVHPYAVTLFASDKGVLKGISGVTGDGAINSGWVFPDEAGKIRVKDTAHCPVACFVACGAFRR